MTVKKTQQTLNTTLEKTEQSLNGLEAALENNVGAHPVREGGEVNDGLPEGWAHSTIKDINFYRSGNVKPSDFAGELFDLYSVPIFPENRPEKVYGKEIGSSKQLVETGDVLLCKINPRINRVWSVGDNTGNRLLASSEWIVVRQSQLSKNYLIRFFQSSGFRDLLCSDVSGVGGSLTRARPKIVETYIVPLPPLAEQTVIAQTLDTLLAQVENIKTRLDAIPKILKTFRQSVLAAAVSGKLTEEWRGENESTWRSVQLGELISFGPQNGIYKPSKDYGSGTSIVRIDGLYDGELVAWDKFKKVRVTTDELNKWKISVGDILINRVNSIEYLGKCGLVRKLEGDLIFESNIMRISPNSKIVNSDYLRTFLTSYIGLERLRSNAKKAVNQASINQTDVKITIIEIPDLEEQTEIVRRVEELFAFADQIEQQVKNAQGRVNNLTQSILAKAFRGALTAQWRAEHPDLITGDNSAEALLAKIQAEREKLKPKKKTIRKKKVVKK